MHPVGSSLFGGSSPDLRGLEQQGWRAAEASGTNDGPADRALRPLQMSNVFWLVRQRPRLGDGLTSSRSSCSCSNS